MVNVPKLQNTRAYVSRRRGRERLRGALRAGATTLTRANVVQVDADFTRARQRAFLHRMKARLRGDPSSTSPLSFEEVRKALGVSNKVRLGRRVVPVERIVGSVGRYRDFEQTFLPARMSVRKKWKRIDCAFHRGEDLPPVVLYKVGEAYFVEDDNHRVRVARYQGVQWIDAEVVGVRSLIPTPVVPGTDPVNFPSELPRTHTSWQFWVDTVGCRVVRSLRTHRGGRRRIA